MNAAIQPKVTVPHYRQGPHVLSRRLDEANDRGYVAQEMLGKLQDDLRKFWQRCKTYKALAIAIADDDFPLAGRQAARLLRAGWATAKVLSQSAGPLVRCMKRESLGCPGQGCRRVSTIGRWGAQAVARAEQHRVPAQLRHQLTACWSGRRLHPNEPQFALVFGSPKPHCVCPRMALLHRRTPRGGRHHRLPRCTNGGIVCHHSTIDIWC